MTLVQLPDDHGDDPSFATFVGFDGDIYNSNQFLLISDPDGRRFLGQIEAPQLNVNRDGLGRFSPQSINQLSALRDDRLKYEVIIRQAHIYLVRYIKDLTSGSTSVRSRSSIGSFAVPASVDDIVRALNLPQSNDSTSIGKIADSDVDISIDIHRVLNHILVAGSTGSGKSNTISNEIAALQQLGACSIVYDHKPDYYHMDEPNDEGDRLSYFRGLSNVSFWNLGGAPDKTTRGDSILLPASAMNTRALAAALFYRDSETQQEEECESLLERYVEDVGRGEDGFEFGLLDFWDWLGANRDQLEKSLYIHKGVMGAILSKVRRPGRRPMWITARSSEGSIRSSSHFDLREQCAPGRIIVINVNPNSHGSVGRSYGLFLSYALDVVNGMQANFPIVHAMDEAQDIFDGSKKMREAVGESINESMRKGRSRRVGFVIGVQSASSVPLSIRNNLQSQVIFRHQRPEMVAEACPVLSKTQVQQTASFVSGECFVKMHEASAVVRCVARRSPFRLPRNGYEI